jgi:tight adherence protein C
MTSAVLIAAVAIAAVGAAMVVVGARAPRAHAGGAADYLASLDRADLVDAPPSMVRLGAPFFARVVRPLSAEVRARLLTLTPSGFLDHVHERLVVAGLSHQVRAEDFATVSVLAAAAGVTGALAWVVFTAPPTHLGMLGLIAIPALFAAAPHAWLGRKIADRKERVFKDLPDMVDLMAMAVEAGTGFEGALALVAMEFDSPLGEEIARTLQEMELGLTRREALQNLKRRVDVRELSNFVLVLTQADALGMPIGRILHVQAAEMRVKRRQWAREKAGKLPVKIIFPLVLFIFPAVLVVVLGPAFGSIFQAFR